MVLAVIIALIVFIGGPTLFILNLIPNAIGSFLGDLPQMASRTAAGDDTMASWLSSWTVFYWAWWISWSPFVGMFMARISRGRTIRQFVTGVLLVPSSVTLLWFSIFGGGAIGIQERATQAGDVGAKLVTMVDGVPDMDFDGVLFDLLGSLPLPGWIAVVLSVVMVLLIAIFFVTGADSASIVMGALSERGAEEPSKKSVIFWGVATGVVAAVMLLAGGSDPSAALNGLKNITIVSALPFVLVMLLLCVAIWKDLSRDPLILQDRVAREVLEQSIVQGLERHDGGEFSLMTREVPVVERKSEPVETLDESDSELEELLTSQAPPSSEAEAVPDGQR